MNVRLDGFTLFAFTFRHERLGKVSERRTQLIILRLLQIEGVTIGRVQLLQKLPLLRRTVPGGNASAGVRDGAICFSRQQRLVLGFELGH